VDGNGFEGPYGGWAKEANEKVAEKPLWAAD
jgi:hypothetical protein